MAFSIGVSGKGGTGKTTISALIVRSLLRKKTGPILAVDADPNSCLDAAIGMRIEKTVGSMIAEFFDQRLSLPAGMTKEAYLGLRLNEMVVEGTGMDLLSMGRGEGPGCYCYPNLMIRKFVEELSGNYRYVVMDNEAGMEHLSRRTGERLDVLLVVSSPTVNGVRAARRIVALVRELGLRVSRLEVVMNMVSDGLSKPVRDELNAADLQFAEIVPEDETVRENDIAGKSLLEVADDSPAVIAVERIVGACLGG